MGILLTADEVANLFQVRRKTVYVWVARRQIPFVKLPGNTTRFPKEAVESWLMKRMSKGQALGRGVYLES